MAVLQTEIKIIYLLHPVERVPAVAQRVGYYYENGRAVGYELQFPGGHRCKLTYAEIGELIEAERTFEA